MMDQMVERGAIGRHDDRRDAPVISGTVQIKTIQILVARYYEITLAELIGPWRGKRVVRPRQIAAYFCKKYTGKPITAIARMTGKRDHTTILHAIRRVEALIDEEEFFKDEIEEIDLLIRRRAVDLSESSDTGHLSFLGPYLKVFLLQCVIERVNAETRLREIVADYLGYSV